MDFRLIVMLSLVCMLMFLTPVSAEKFIYVCNENGDVIKILQGKENVSIWLEKGLYYIIYDRNMFTVNMVENGVICLVIPPSMISFDLQILLIVFWIVLVLMISIMVVTKR